MLVAPRLEYQMRYRLPTRKGFTFPMPALPELALIPLLKGLSDVFLISLCKWLAKLTMSEKSHLEVINTIGYKVCKEPQYPYLVSIANKITPQIVIGKDPVGLAQVEATSSKLDECAMAIQAIESIDSQIDADKMLASDPSLYTQMADEMKSLLELARYDTTLYSACAKEHS